MKHTRQSGQLLELRPVKRQPKGREATEKSPSRFLTHHLGKPQHELMRTHSDCAIEVSGNGLAFSREHEIPAEPESVIAIKFTIKRITPRGEGKAVIIADVKCDYSLGSKVVLPKIRNYLESISAKKP